MIPGGDWHSDYCANIETVGFDGKLVSIPCDCGWDDARITIESEAVRVALMGLRYRVERMPSTYAASDPDIPPRDRRVVLDRTGVLSLIVATERSTP